MNLSKEIASMYDDAVRIRRDLHRIPEIGFQLHDTQAYVLNELRQCAPDRLETPAVCGVKAVFFAKDAQKTIALRADMDGIHNDEANDVPYRSQRPGCMHGCGHDGHMTILLLLARWIARNRARLHCNVVLLFQPGEEGWAGARRMIDDGALENPRVDCIYGLHLWPTVPKGRIGIRWDYLMAQTSDFEITVHGKSAHASTPQMGIDAIVVAAELITMVQTVITRALLLAADIPVFAGVGGGLTQGQRVVNLAMFAEMQGATGVVLNAPTANTVVQHVAETIDIPVVVTVARADTDFDARLQSGTNIFNVSAAAETPAIVRSIRERYPDVPIIATGGPTDESILETIQAGANAITWTPPSNGEIFRDIMAAYRDNKPHP